MFRKRQMMALLLTAGITLAGTAWADTFVLQGPSKVQDTFVTSYIPFGGGDFGAGFSNYSADASMSVGKASETYQGLNRSYIRFDLSTIPSNFQVTNAYVTLWNWAAGASANTNSLVSFYRATNTMQASDMTFVYRKLAPPVTNAWTQSGLAVNPPYGPYPGAGGDFATTASGSALISWSAVGNFGGEAFDVGYNWNVTSDVSNMVAGAYVNYGWLIRRDFGPGGDGGGTEATGLDTDFRTTQFVGTLGHTPSLVIQGIPEPSSLALCSAIAVAASIVIRRRRTQ